MSTAGAADGLIGAGPPPAPDELADLQRRTLRVLVVSQLFSGAGLASGISVGALLAEDMIGGSGVGGVPTALFTLGSAGAAVAVGALSQRHGRRVGLVSGFLTGAVGAVGVVVAAVLDSIPLLLLALLVYGAGTSTNLQARYAGADLAETSRRGAALSTVMVATTVGAVAGPNLVAPMGAAAGVIGVPELAGPFILSAAAYAAAGMVLSVLLRPDPLLTAIAHGVGAGTIDESGDPRAPVGRGLVVGATVMVITQIAMVAIMTMTPVHMRDHGHGLGAVGLVIGAHIAFMYLPSPLTGRLADRLGRVTIAVVAAVILLAAGVVAALAPGESVLWLAVALGLLGLGWNAGLIAGTALVVDAAPLSVRARMQGRIDLLIALAGAGGGALSGVVVAGASFAALSLAGGALALVLVPVVAWYRLPGRPAGT